MVALREEIRNAERSIRPPREHLPLSTAGGGSRWCVWAATPDSDVPRCAGRSVESSPVLRDADVALPLCGADEIPSGQRIPSSGPESGDPAERRTAGNGKARCDNVRRWIRGLLYGGMSDSEGAWIERDSILAIGLDWPAAADLRWQRIYELVGGSECGFLGNADRVPYRHPSAIGVTKHTGCRRRGRPVQEDD